MLRKKDTSAPKKDTSAPPLRPLQLRSLQLRPLQNIFYFSSFLELGVQIIKIKMKLIRIKLRSILKGYKTMINMIFFHDRKETTSSPTTSAPQYFYYYFKLHQCDICALNKILLWDNLNKLLFYTTNITVDSEINNIEK